MITAAALACLALNVYHEARNQPVEGQIAVVHVTLNRVKSKKYPDTVCEVVNQRKQFSWTHDEISDVQYERNTFLEIQTLIDKIFKEKIKDPTFGSTHYHADYVDPYRTSSYQKVALIGNHIFYKP